MSTTPYATPQSHVADVDLREGLEVTWGRAVKVWWSIGWRTLVVSVVLGFAVGIVVGIVAAAGGMGTVAASALGQIIGGVLGIIISMWAVRKALTRSFSDFRIVLVPK
jgi:hypothetical protein